MDDFAEAFRSFDTHGGCYDDSHIWTYAGDPNLILHEGTPCDCGLKSYIKPPMCPTCGQNVEKIT